MPRDGPVWPDDPTKTKMANCVDHMRHHPTYMPPNTWPEGMIIFGFVGMMLGEQRSLRVVATIIVPLTQFEEISVAGLFGLIDPEANVILCMPTTQMPRDQAHAELMIEGIYAVNDMQNIFTYLHDNGWEVHKEGVV